MKVGPLFEKLRSCLKKIVVVQGGGDAGKTVTILQYLGIYAIQNPDKIITVTSRTVPHLKKGALRAFQKYVLPYIRRYVVNYNSTERVYTFANGTIIEFLSFKDDLDARGSERDILFMNEVNAQTYSQFWQLQRKTRYKVFLDYNPSSHFWVHSKVLPGPGQEKQFTGQVQLYIVDHRHNPFLTKEEHEAYESISDPDLFMVYSRGRTGIIKGVIYRFRRVETIPEDCDRIIWGIDYGYTNDPTALVKIGIKGRKRYVKCCAYEPGISAKRIGEILELNGYDANEPIYSEHDVNMIIQLKRLGLSVFHARKGPGSIIAKISKVKEYECYYTDDSIRTEEGLNIMDAGMNPIEEELKHYKWVMAEDVNTGKEVMTNIPVDGFDHTMNASEYAIYTDSFRNAA